jgi:hypothetical protein
MFPTSLNSHHLAAVSATLRISPYGLCSLGDPCGKIFSAGNLQFTPSLAGLMREHLAGTEEEGSR